MGPAQAAQRSFRKLAYAVRSERGHATSAVVLDMLSNQTWMAIRLGMFTLDRRSSRLGGALGEVVDALLPQPLPEALVRARGNILGGQSSSPRILGSRGLRTTACAGECEQQKKDATLPRRDLSGMPGGAAESPWRPTWHCGTPVADWPRHCGAASEGLARRGCERKGTRGAAH